MSRLLEILGRAITVDTADLIWQWLGAVKLSNSQGSFAQQQLDKIVELSKKQIIETEAAEQQLRLYLFENPSCVKGRLAAAAICLRKNQLQSAIDELNSVYLRQPNNTMALYALGHCYERIGKESEAAAFYQDCLKFKNYLQLPRQRLAAIYFKNGQLEKTITEYELLKSEEPDDIATLVMLGYLYIATGKYAKAFETFNTAILIHPDNFNMQDDGIEQLIAEGRLHEAAEQIDYLLEQWPESVELIAKRADILVMLGASDEALCRYQEALRIRPDFLEATIKLGTLYMQCNSEQLAAEQFNKAVEINDQIVDAYVGLATAQKLGGKVSDALATLSLAVAIDANSSILFAETACLQFKAGLAENSDLRDQINGAELIKTVIETHQRQITARPQNPDLHYRLGIFLTSVGMPDKAVEVFRTALEINPMYTRAKSKMILYLAETGEQQAALEQLAGPSYLDKQTLQLHYKTALLYCDKLKFTSSLINLDRYLENNFACSDATVNISIVLQNLGLLDRAAVMWDNLSEMTGNARQAS